MDDALNLFESKEIKGEFTIVIHGFIKEKNKEIDYSNLKKDLNELVNAGLSLSAASKYLSRKLNIAKNLIYSLYFKKNK